MKHEQVVVDYWSMVKSSGLCLLLAFSGYILLKMVQTIFWLPKHLKSNQKRLEELTKQFGDIDPEEREKIERMIRGEEELNFESLCKTTESNSTKPEEKSITQATVEDDNDDDNGNDNDNEEHKKDK